MKLQIIIAALAVTSSNARLVGKANLDIMDKTTMDNQDFITYHRIMQDSNATLQQYPCTINEECGFGICIEQECVCSKGYVSNGAPCNREKTGFVTPMILTVFFGAFGAGRFYIGNDDIGAIYLALTLFLMFFPCTWLCCIEKSANIEIYGNYYKCIVSLYYTIVWITEIVLFATCQVTDADGFALDC